MTAKSNTTKRLLVGLLAVIILISCFALSIYAYILAVVGVSENHFQTGTIKINLNDGKPIITEDEYLFEPGMTVEKMFFVENNSTFEVYYRIYFENVNGNLADVLQVTLTTGDTVVYEGTLAEMVRDNVKAAENSLKVGEAHWYKISFHFPENKENECQDKELTFDIVAEAVQTKNNPDRLFD